MTTVQDPVDGARARDLPRDRRWRGRFAPGSLARRLAASYAVVVLVDVIVFVAAARFLAPLAHRSSGPEPLSAEVLAYKNQLEQSLLRALAIGAAISLAVGAVATVAITRLMMEPLVNLRASAQRLREGRYGEQIPLPRQPELADLASELNMLAARLADVETRRARLVSDLGHELRTPLTIIEGQLVGVADGVYEFSPELLDSVREELDRLRRLTEDLSGLSRAEENAYTLITQRTDLASLAVQLGVKLRPQFAHHDIDLICATAGPAWAVVDPARVTQILSNLLINALDATPAGGRVTCTVTQRPELVTIEISDTGRGIGTGDLARIFDRFERVAPARESNGAAGSGIGLTIARSLARAHGGTLTADSPGPDLGATLTLVLPTQPAALLDPR